MGEKVDKGFAQLNALNQNLSKISKNIINSFDKDDDWKGGVELCAMAISIFNGVAGCVSAVRAARQHNKYLDELLLLKQEIAQEKLQSIIKIESSVNRAVKSISKLVRKEALSELTLTNVKSDVLDMKLSVMNRTLLIYRTTIYSQLLIRYLHAEYEAWIDGMQYSEVDRPTLFDANVIIVDNLQDCLKGTDCNLDFLSLVHFQKSDILGAQLYLCTDSQLLSLAMLAYGMSMDELTIKKLPKIQESPFSPYLKSNIAYKTYRKSYYKFNYWVKWFNGYVCVFLILLAILTILLSLFTWLNWPGWVEWILGIVVFIMGGIITFGNYETLEKAYQERTNNFCSKAIFEMMSISGYVEIFRPDLDRKSLIAAGFKGAVKGFISFF